MSSPGRKKKKKNLLGEGEGARLLAWESWASSCPGWVHRSSKSAVTAPFAPRAAQHREARPRRPSVRNGSPYLERHGGTQLRDSLAHPASGAAPAGGCTETLETLEDSGPAPHARRWGQGPGRAGIRSVGSSGSARQLASREGGGPASARSPPGPHRDNDAGADYTSQRAPWLGRGSGRCGGDALYCSAPRTSTSSGSGTRLESASSRQACGCACSGAKNRSPKQPPTHPCLLSASCAAARWGCVDKKGPVSPIGRSHANPTPSD